MSRTVILIAAALLSGCATTQERDLRDAHKALCVNPTPQVEEELAQGAYWLCRWPRENRDIVQRINRGGDQ